MIEIRRSTPEDGRRVVDIWRSAVDATHHFLHDDDRRSIEMEVAAFLPQAPLWLATLDGNPVAFMLLDGTHMEALFVDASHRGSGAGRTLVTHALTLCEALTTDVNEQNTQAIGFYERLGFKRTGRSSLDAQGRAYPLIHLRHGGAPRAW